MDIVFTLVKNSTSHECDEEYITTSQNIYDILDAMYNQSYAEIHDLKIYVTEYGRNNIPYKEWRKQ